MAAFIDTVNLLVSPLPLHKRDIERIVGRVRHNFEISRKRRKKERKETGDFSKLSKIANP